MNQLQRYYWFAKGRLRMIAIYFLVYIFASGLVLGLLDALGGGDISKSVVTFVLFFGFVGWTGHKLRTKQPPGELDMLAKRDDSPSARRVIELLEGNSSVNDENVHTLVSSLFDATKTSQSRSRFWSGLDCGEGEVYERLFGLYSEHRDKRLLLVIERLARDAPLEASAYEELLFEELDPDGDAEGIQLDDWRPRTQHFWTIPALVLAHISRELPGSAERYTPKIIKMLDPQGDQNDLLGVLALGELAAHDDNAKEKIQEIRDSRVAGLRNAANEILAHYEESDQPYPAEQRLDEFDREHQEKKREWERDVDRAKQNIWNDDWWEDDW